MPELSIVSLYAGISGVIYFILSSRIIKLRNQLGVSLGDGTLEIIKASYNNKNENQYQELLKRYSPLSKAIRAHANFAEYVPFILLLIGGIEAHGASPTTVHALGTTLLISRLAHLWGLQFLKLGPNVLRVVGTISTFFLLFGTSVYNIYLFKQSYLPRG